MISMASAFEQPFNLIGDDVLDLSRENEILKTKKKVKLVVETREKSQQNRIKKELIFMQGKKLTGKT